MKIVCISDTHGLHRAIDVPEGEVLIHAGDMLNHGTIQELDDFRKWLWHQPHPYKIVVAGNHDWCFERQPNMAQEAIRSAGAIYLQDRTTTLANGLRVHGSPWTPVFFDWAFMLGPEDIKEKWEQIGYDLDILVTHGPARGFLDKTAEMWGNKSVGCEELGNRMDKVTPRLHVFGHIHNGYGAERKFGVQRVNASICTEEYKPTNKPIVVEL